MEKPSALYLVRCPAIEIRRTREFFLNEKENLVTNASQLKTSRSSNKIKSSLVLNQGEHRVFIAIGTNVGNKLANIHRALTKLKNFCRIHSTSFLYETPPAYVLDQPSFLNAACEVFFYFHCIFQVKVFFSQFAR